MFFDGYGYHGTSFEQKYRCYSASFIDKPQIENGDKIIMPPSALDHLASLHIDRPVLFELHNASTERVSHCGVLEFIAEEGMIYMPYWMMENLLLQEGDIVRVKNVTLPKGTYVKLQPNTKDLLDISNPKAILETMLSNFSCLSTGDSIMVAHNNKKYYMDIIETKPSNAISIIEADCEVDYAPPLDYKEPEKPVATVPSSKALAEDRVKSKNSSIPDNLPSPTPQSSSHVETENLMSKAELEELLAQLQAPSTKVVPLSESEAATHIERGLILSLRPVPSNDVGSMITTANGIFSVFNNLNVDFTPLYEKVKTFIRYSALWARVPNSFNQGSSLEELKASYEEKKNRFEQISSSHTMMTSSVAESDNHVKRLQQEVLKTTELLEKLKTELASHKAEYDSRVSNFLQLSEQISKSKSEMKDAFDILNSSKRYESIRHDLEEAKASLFG